MRRIKWEAAKRIWQTRIQKLFTVIARRINGVYWGRISVNWRKAFWVNICRVDHKSDSSLAEKWPTEGFSKSFSAFGSQNAPKQRLEGDSKYCIFVNFSLFPLIFWNEVFSCTCRNYVYCRTNKPFKTLKRTDLPRRYERYGQSKIYNNLQLGTL